jgi:predicted CopG family antitoxin
MVHGVPIKTTVVLRDEVYEYLVKKFGRRKISEAINPAVMKQLVKPPF